MRIRDLFKIFNRSKSRDVNLKCERQYKTDATGFRIAGIDYGGFKLAGVEVERTLQNVTQALLALDFSQYQLCLSIRSMKGTKQQEYIEKMTDQQLKAHEIHQALYALSLNPDSTQLLDLVKEKFLRSVQTIDSIPKNSQADITAVKEKIQSIHTKVTFYDIVIKKLDRMLDNPFFISMRHPEEIEKVHQTLKEIDDLMDQTLIDRDITLRYREIRGPWEGLYSGAANDRSKFVYGVRDFRNYLAKSFNKLIPEYKSKTGQDLDKIELDEKEYVVRD